MSHVLKKAEKKLDYKFLFENAVSGICLTKLDGEIVDCNETFLQISGIKDADEVVLNNINNCFLNPDKELFKFNSSSQENPNTQFYAHLLSKEGNKIPCLVCGKHIELDGTKHLLINVIDISNQKLKEPKVPHFIDEKDYQIETLKKRLFLSEEKFHTILELTDSAVCVQNESKILFVNPAWEKLTGYAKNKIDQLQTPFNIIHPNFRKLAQNRYRARLEGRKVPEDYDLKIVTKSKSNIWVNAKVSVVDYEDERALMAVFTDITERMRTQQALKDSKKKFQSLFYENTSIMFMVDPENGNIVDANEAACKFYGYPKAKIVSLNIKNINILTKSEIKTEIDKAVAEKRKYFFFKHKLSNNEIRDVEVYSGKVEIRNTFFLYSIVHDITARKKAEEALKRSENELKQLNAQKDKFFSIIAHDLKGPLGTFMQLTEYLKENYKNLEQESFEKYLKHLFASARGSFKLLENLLDWTRSQLGVIELNPEIINVQKYSINTISILEESAHAKDIKIQNKIPSDLFVYADKNTIDTVLRNLVANAIKFTDKKGKITLNAKKTFQETDNQSFIEVSIHDNGIGIPDEHIEKLFKIEKNYSSLGTNNEKGTGLGLILCKELVIKNGGSIWVESLENNGSTFTFKLPEYKA